MWTENACGAAGTRKMLNGQSFCPRGDMARRAACPAFLSMLKKHGIHATFFVPGFTVDEYPDMVRQMDAEGHELGNHSWSHTYPDNMSGYDEEMKEYLDCSDIMEKVVGYRPKGYRSPAWEFSPYTLDILEQHLPEIAYSSNMMDTERIRYLTVNGQKDQAGGAAHPLGSGRCGFLAL